MVAYVEDEDKCYSIDINNKIAKIYEKVTDVTMADAK